MRQLNQEGSPRYCEPPHLRGYQRRPLVTGEEGARVLEVVLEGFRRGPATATEEVGNVPMNEVVLGGSATSEARQGEALVFAEEEHEDLLHHPLLSCVGGEQGGVSTVRDRHRRLDIEGKLFEEDLVLDEDVVHSRRPPLGFVSVNSEQPEGGEHTGNRLRAEEILFEELGGLTWAEKTVETGEDTEGCPAVARMIKASGYREGEVHGPSSSHSRGFEESPRRYRTPRAVQLVLEGRVGVLNRRTGGAREALRCMAGPEVLKVLRQEGVEGLRGQGEFR